MRLAVLGAGVIGTTVGRRWQHAGHDVTYGARDPNSDRYGELTKEASVESIPQAVGGAEATLIAIPGNALEDLLETQGETLDGTLLLDATNSLSGGHFHRIPLFEARVPAARVYRAFSTLGWENFADPVINGEQADLFYSGPSGADQPIVEQLIADVGLRPVHVGTEAAGADVLDGVTRLWFSLQQTHGRHLAFRTLGLSTEPHT